MTECLIFGVQKRFGMIWDIEVLQNPDKGDELSKFLDFSDNSS